MDQDDWRITSFTFKAPISAIIIPVKLTKQHLCEQALRQTLGILHWGRWLEKNQQWCVEDLGILSMELMCDEGQSHRMMSFAAHRQLVGGSAAGGRGRTDKLSKEAYPSVGQSDLNIFIHSYSACVLNTNVFYCTAATLHCVYLKSKKYTLYI